MSRWLPRRPPHRPPSCAVAVGSWSACRHSGGRGRPAGVTRSVDPPPDGGATRCDAGGSMPWQCAPAAGVAGAGKRGVGAGINAIEPFRGPAAPPG